jgi:death-on-curing family protein
MATSGAFPAKFTGAAADGTMVRPQQKWHCADAPDIPGPAAAYAFGVVKDHPYRDGNKRIGFLAMVTFLGVNGWEFDATDTEVVNELVALAAGTVSEEALADRIRQHSSVRRWSDCSSVRDSGQRWADVATKLAETG